MIKWLIRIVWGCSGPCKLKEVKRGQFKYSNADYYTMRCETCGRMKEYRF